MSFLTKLRKGDIIVISLVAIVLLAGIIFFVTRGSGKDVTSKQTKIEFDLELAEVSKAIADEYRLSVGKTAVYGVANVDQCKLERISTAPFEKLVADTENELFVLTEVQDKLKITATFSATVTETDYEFKGDYDIIVAGMQQLIHGKGYSMKGYITDVRVIN